MKRDSRELASLARSSFENGRISDAIDWLLQLAEMNSGLAENIFELYRHVAVRRVEAWAARVLSSPSIFLPIELFEDEIPESIMDAERFSIDHGLQAVSPTSQHAEVHGGSRLVGATAKEAIARWHRDAQIRSMLVSTRPADITLAEEIVAGLANVHLARKGIRWFSLTPDEQRDRVFRALEASREKERSAATQTTLVDQVNAFLRGKSRVKSSPQREQSDREKFFAALARGNEDFDF